MIALLRRRAAAPEHLILNGRTVPLLVARMPTARRVSLRADPSSGEVKLTLPRRAALAEGLALVETHRGWLTKQVAKWPEPQPFAPDAEIPFNGGTLIIDWQEGASRRHQIADGRLTIGGPRDGLSARVERALKRHAANLIGVRAHALAASIDKSIKRISLRDPRGRWASCSPDGALGFSWRLVLAPDWVRDSVVAHEVAHLVHMNHGSRFWALAEKLYGAPMDEARAWLSANGATLHWVGRDAP